MPELETDLARLATELEWPPTPDLAGGALTRLAGAGPVRRRRPRRALAVLVAALVLGLPAAAIAFPGARDDVLEWLGLRHVTVERRRVAPAARAPAPQHPLSLAEAARRAGLAAPLVPTALRGGTASAEADVLTLTRGRLRLQEHDGTLARELLRKLVTTADDIRRVRVHGRPALWFGGPHSYLWLDSHGDVREGPPVRSGPSLVWEQDGLVLRLEGRGLTLRRALEVARSGS